MAILTSQTLINYADNYRVCRAFYDLKVLLLSAGWTVAGSANGTTGGMDGVDRITTYLSLNSPTASWLVMQSPHAVASDRIQLLFRLISPTTGNYPQGLIGYDPQRGLTSASTAIPTSSTMTVVRTGYLFTSSTTENHRVLALADDQSPYGFAFQVTAANNPRYEISGIGFIPLSVRHPSNPGKPYVVIAGSCTNGGVFAYKAPFQTYLISWTTSAFSLCMAEPRNPPKAPVVSPAAVLQDSSGAVFPSTLISNGTRSVSIPTTFTHLNGFVGQSDFMRSNGFQHRHLSLLYNESGVGDRIVLGEFNFPWDGSTPLI